MDTKKFVRHFCHCHVLCTIRVTNTNLPQNFVAKCQIILSLNPELFYRCAPRITSLWGPRHLISATLCGGATNALSNCGVVTLPRYGIARHFASATLTSAFQLSYGNWISAYELIRTALNGYFSNLAWTNAPADSSLCWF